MASSEPRGRALRSLGYAWLIVEVLSLIPGLAVFFSPIGQGYAFAGSVFFYGNLACVFLMFWMLIARSKNCAIVAAIHALLNSTMIVTAAIIVLSAKSSSKSGDDAGFMFFLVAMQAIVIVFAVRLWKATDDPMAEWMRSNPLEHALLFIFALAAREGGGPTPEACALALAAYQDVFGRFENEAVLKERFVRLCEIPEAREQFQRAWPQLMQRISAEQRAWVFSRACAVASPDGDTLPATRQFLDELSVKLDLAPKPGQTPSAYEPFGRR